MEKYDVVIVGAGPAGLKAAEVLAKNGKEVLVLEKNKIIGKKVCAGGLTEKTLKLGIPKSILGRHFKRIFIHTPHDTTILKNKKDIVVTIGREDLGKWQAKQVKKVGAEIKINSKVTKIKSKSIIINNKKEVGFNYLIGADGTNSIVRKYLGLETKKVEFCMEYKVKQKFRNLEFFLDAELFGPCYGYIFPHKKYTWIGCGTDPNFMSLKKLKQNMDAWIKDNNWDISKTKLKGALINYDYRGFKFGNKFLVGDAGGFASGLTGEGIFFAMVSGEDVARGILDKNYKFDKIKELLEIKKRNEEVLKSLEFSKVLAEIEYESFALLMKNRILGEFILKLVE